nr:repetitive proline-rich cell wall protein 2 [Osmia lignaria]
MIRALISLLLASLSILPSVMSYAKVSRNGQEEAETKDDSNSWIVSNVTQSEGRSIKNIAITMAPVYIAPKIPNLHNGEATNYSPGGRYTTLDHEMLGKLNAKKQLQDRYHPAPLSSFKNKEPSKDVKESPKVVARPSNPPSGPPSSSTFDFSNPPFSDIYEYKPPPDYLSSKPISKPPDYLGDKPISKPLSMDDYTDTEISDKPPDSYEPDSYKPDSYKPDSYLMSHEPDYSDFPDDAPYNGNPPAPKPMKHSPPSDHPPYDANDNDNDDNDAYPHHHDFHHELIYDHIPEYHDHTEEPEMNDQRLDKRPYSYYFIGKKLWYVPLYFSIYFVIYIAALVLKSIARHKITFPAHLADAVGHHSRSYGDTSWWDYAGNVLEGVESFAEKYGKIS